jgi:hypothetical protein
MNFVDDPVKVLILDVTVLVDKEFQNHQYLILLSTTHTHI